METNKIEAITVTKERIDKMYAILSDYPEDSKISFEFVLSMLFPTVWNNINEAMKDCYTKGYLQGKEDFESKNLPLE